MIGGRHEELNCWLVGEGVPGESVCVRTGREGRVWCSGVKEEERGDGGNRCSGRREEEAKGGWVKREAEEEEEVSRGLS